MKSRVVTGCLIEKNGAYLFGKKRPGVGPYKNSLVMIGGGIHLEDESVEEGVKREVKEETNLDIKDLKRISFDEDWEPDKNEIKTHYLFLIYTAKYQSGVEKAGDDIIELKWIKKSDFKNYTFARPTIKLFKEIGWL